VALSLSCFVAVFYEDMKYVILIPAYNAEKTLPQLLRQIGALTVLPDKVFVIDDGSGDRTVELAKNDNLTVVMSLPVNRGKGEALKQGFDLIRRQSDAEFILCMDADLQHPVASVSDFLKAAETSDSRFIIGRRERKSGLMPVHRILSNTITSWMISLLSGQKIPDSQCGFRLIHRKVIERMDLREEGFQLESEMIVRAARLGCRIGSVDIPTVYNGKSSNISNLKDTVRFIRWVMREFIGR